MSLINPKHKFALEVQCDQTLWQKDETRVRGAHGISEAACWGLFPRLRDRGEEQLGTRDRYTRTGVNTIFLCKMQSFPAFKKPNGFIFLGWVK